MVQKCQRSIGIATSFPSYILTSILFSPFFLPSDTPFSSLSRPVYFISRSSGLNHSRKSCSKLIPVSSDLNSACVSKSSNVLATDCINSFVRKLAGTSGSDVVGCDAGLMVGVPLTTADGEGAVMLELVALGVGGAVLTCVPPLGFDGPCPPVAGFGGCWFRGEPSAPFGPGCLFTSLGCSFGGPPAGEGGGIIPIGLFCPKRLFCGPGKGCPGPGLNGGSPGVAVPTPPPGIFAIAFVTA